MIEYVIVLAMSLGFFCYRIWRRLELLERSMIERITREICEIERRQAEREDARVRLLVDCAGQVGSVKGVTELLAGLLAQMNAKLDRQVGAPIRASVS